MAVRSIDEVIGWIRACPIAGERYERLIRLLNDFRDLLEPQRLKYTVSMFSRVNAEPDDGKDGIETSFPEKWFTIEPLAFGYRIAIGSHGNLIRSVDVTSAEARGAVTQAIIFVMGPVDG